MQHMLVLGASALLVLSAGRCTAIDVGGSYPDNTTVAAAVGPLWQPIEVIIFPVN